MANSVAIEPQQLTDAPAPASGAPPSPRTREIAAESSAELQTSFRRYDQQITINNIQLGCLLGMLLMPAGVILDFFTYSDQPEVIWDFFQLRILCSVLIGAFWIYVRSDAGKTRYRTLGIILALLPALCI
jgi:hypothetical protein